MTVYSVGSMFAGVGGICLGFQMASTNKAKYVLKWANDIDENACKTYGLNFKHELIIGDINFIINPKKLKDMKRNNEDEDISCSSCNSKNAKIDFYDFNYYLDKHKQITEEPIDILTAGFPCQAFSIAGEQKGFNDSRGNLFLSIIDLINLLDKKFYKPRVIFLENVKNLKAHDSGRTYKVIKDKLETCGYKIKDCVINTMYFSQLPQNRERIYIVGFRDIDDYNKFDFDKIVKTHKRQYNVEERRKQISEIIDKNIKYSTHPQYYYTKEKYPLYFNNSNEKDFESKKAKINIEKEINEYYQFYQIRRGQYVRKNKSNVCPTLTANMGMGGHNVPIIKVKDGIRRITPKEAFRLQGFPVDAGYFLNSKNPASQLSDCHLYKQAGNSVSVPVIQLLAEELLKVLRNG